MANLKNAKKEYHEIMDMLKSIGYTDINLYDSNIEGMTYNVMMLSDDKIQRVLDNLKKLSEINTEIRDTIYTKLFIREASENKKHKEILEHAFRKTIHGEVDKIEKERKEDEIIVNKFSKMGMK